MKAHDPAALGGGTVAAGSSPDRHVNRFETIDQCLGSRFLGVSIGGQGANYERYYGLQQAPAESTTVARQTEDTYLRTQHLNQIELSRRWRISPRTLERYRWLQKGPAYLKIGGRIVYRLADVEAYEMAQRRDSNAVSESGAGYAN